MADVYSLKAQLNHPDATGLYWDCYCYDDPLEGIVAEPLVHQTTAAIQFFLEGRHPQSVTDNDFQLPPPKYIQLSFSEEQQASWDRGVVVELNFLDGDVDGTTYEVHPVAPKTSVLRAIAAEQLYGHLECWLCAHLLDYFSKPPSKFFCHIIPA